MSIAELNRFEKDVHSNSALMEEVKKAGTDENAVVAFAKSKGYDFTLEELLAYVDKRKATLSDEALDKIAGGTGQTTEVVAVVSGEQVEQVVMINPVVTGTSQIQAVQEVAVTVA